MESFEVGQVLEDLHVIGAYTNANCYMLVSEVAAHSCIWCSAYGIVPVQSALMDLARLPAPQVPKALARAASRPQYLRCCAKATGNGPFSVERKPLSEECHQWPKTAMADMPTRIEDL